jgi:hypothetical protein
LHQFILLLIDYLLLAINNIRRLYRIPPLYFLYFMGYNMYVNILLIQHCSRRAMQLLFYMTFVSRSICMHAKYYSLL